MGGWVGLGWVGLELVGLFPWGWGFLCLLSVYFVSFFFGFFFFFYLDFVGFFLLCCCCCLVWFLLLGLVSTNLNHIHVLCKRNGKRIYFFLNHLTTVPISTN